MAKKSSASKNPNKGRKTESVTPDTLASWAAEVREMAEILASCAKGMDAMSIPELKVNVGNYNASMGFIKTFLAIEIIGKLNAEASRNGHGLTAFPPKSG